MSIMRVGFTGTRNGLTDAQINTLCYALLWLKPTQFTHGSCIGADEDSHYLFISYMRLHNLPEHALHIRPSTAKTRADCVLDGAVIYPLEDPLVRNVKIVQSSDVIIGCPQRFKEEQRSGTWHAIRATIAQKKPLLLIWPDGKVATL